jgi:hypothetical protein
VILSPTVQPALLLPLVLTLLKNEYVVLLALPTLDEVEYLERKVKKLGGGLMGGLWVGVLDPFDVGLLLLLPNELDADTLTDSPNLLSHSIDPYMLRLQRDTPPPIHPPVSLSPDPPLITLDRIPTIITLPYLIIYLA